MLRRRCAGCLVCQWEDIAAAVAAIDLEFPRSVAGGVTGKSSLATADAPGNTDRPRWLGVKCVIAERQLRSRPDNRQIAGGVA